MGSEPVGTVRSILRYPVKSMLGEEVGAAELADRGLVGDRAFALVDDETGKVVSVKRPKRWGRIFELSARTGTHGVVVTFPDGTSLAIDDPTLLGRLADLFGRAVSIASVPAADATFDEQWVRELKGDVAPYFDLPSRTEDDVEVIDAGQLMGSFGTFFNFGAVHLVTTSSTRRLGELAPGSRVDPHRFRPNIVIDTDGDGFLETGWQGRTLSIGGVRLAMSFTVPRCIMTTLAQGDLPADPAVLRTITAANAVDCFGSGATYPCLGVYADVAVGGTVEVGQPVTLEEP
jgi:uncharacterized protein YcbX